jgi:hypothetical protein
MTDLTETQRTRLIQNIIDHTSEERTISKEEYTWEEISEDEESWDALDDENLIRAWAGWVGEWICSIGSEYPRLFEAWLDVEDEYDNPADWQLEKLLADGRVDYGYNFAVYNTPYLPPEQPEA